MRALAGAVALGWVLWAAPALASVWLWTDAAGVVRYTTHPERIPSSARGSMQEVVPGMALPPPPAQAAASAPAAPAAPLPAVSPPEGVGFEADPFNAPGQARHVEGQQVPEPAQPPPATAPRVASTEPVSPPAPPATPPAPVAEQPPVAPTAPAPAPAVASNAPAAAQPALAAPPPLAPAPAAAATPPAPASAPAPATPPVAAAPPGSRRAELQAQIARDEAALKDLISRPADPNAPVEASPELREIAKRLPALQAELRALEESQARAETP